LAKRHNRAFLIPVIIAASVAGSPAAGGESGPPGPAAADVEAMKDEAFAVAQQLIKDLPASVDPLGLMGTVHNQFGNTQEAVKWWRKCLARNPRRADAYHGLGMVAMKKSQYEEAAQLWRKAQETDPTLPGVHGCYAAALLELGKPAEAIAALEQELKLAADNTEGLLLLGQACLQQKLYDRALASYQRVYELQPDASPACYGLAQAYARLGRADKASEFTAKFSALRAEEEQRSSARRKAEPDRVWASKVLAKVHGDAAKVYLGNRMPLRAEEHLLRADALDPKNAAYLQDLVEAYISAGRMQEAARVCEQLRAMEPKNPTYQLNTGVLHARLGQFGAAEEAIRKAIQLAPARPTAHRSLVRLLLVQKGRAADARAAAQRLVEVERTAESYALLAEACHCAGEAAAAREALARAADVNRMDKEYLRVRQRVEEGK